MRGWNRGGASRPHNPGTSTSTPQADTTGKLSCLGEWNESRENVWATLSSAPCSRVLARLASLAQIGELARRLSRLHLKERSLNLPAPDLPHIRHNPIYSFKPLTSNSYSCYLLSDGCFSITWNLSWMYVYSTFKLIMVYDIKNSLDSLSGRIDFGCQFFLRGKSRPFSHPCPCFDHSFDQKRLNR